MRTPQLILLAFALAALPAGAERLDFRHVSLDLPAAPAVMLPVDLDGDGRRDLVTALIYSEWDQISIEESTEMDGVEGLVEVLTIVPSLDERRELRVWLADPSAPSGYRPAAQWMELDRSVVGLEAGPPGIPVLALTDDGMASLVLDDEGLRFEPLVDDPPVLSGTGTLIPNLGIVRDVSGDGIDDVLLPARDGLAVYLGTGDGIAAEPAARLRLPSDEFDTLHGRRIRRYPLPQVRDVSGDGLPDLLLPDRSQGWNEFHVLINRGSGVFGSPVEVKAPESCPDEADDPAHPTAPCLDGEPRHFGDLDGDGLAEWVYREDLSDPDAGMRKEMKEAKNPPGVFRLHRSKGGDGDGDGDDGYDFAPSPDPYSEFRAVGYSIEAPGDQGDEDFEFPGGLADLDGDGDQDIIALTLDFSMFQVLRVMTTKTFGMGIDFHLFCLGEDGYEPVQGLDLSGKFRIHLDDVRLSHLSLFEGDFDADGRRDFVQMGRGKDVTIHRGREGCRYPSDPDWTIRLEEEPANLALVRVQDFDGDGRSDLGVLQPLPRPDDGASRPVRFELYLSQRQVGSGGEAKR